jgi:uncharacterized membrane protein YesL
MWRRGPDGEIVRAPLEPAAASHHTEITASGEAAPATSRRRVSLGVALRLGLRDTYDYLGALMLLTFAWTMLAFAGVVGGQAVGLTLFGALPPTLAVVLAVACALLGLVLVGSPVTAGVFRYARNAAARQEPELYDLAWGFRTVWRSSLGLGAIQAFGALLLAGNCYFYVSQRHPVVVVIGAVFGYVLAFWLLACLYQWPLLAEQQLTPIAAVKKSALLVLDNFGFTLSLALLLAVVSVALWLTVIGGALLWAGAVAMFLTQATRELLRKYHVLPPDPTLDPIAEETHDLDH